MAKLLRTDGTQSVVQPKNGSCFQLQELHDLLGVNCVELVYLRDGKHILVVDESGWLKQDPELNVLASILYGGDIVGNALFCKRNQIF